MNKKTVKILMLSAMGLFGVASLSSCDRVKEAVEDVAVPVPFDIKFSKDLESTFGTLPTNTYVRYPEISMDIDVDAKIKEKYPNLSVNNLKSVKLSALSIEYISSTLNILKLDAIKDAKLYVKAPNQPEVLAATVVGNTNPNVINFTPVDNVELINYFKSKQNSIILEVKSDKLTVDGLKFRVNPAFKVSVGL